MTTPPTRPRKPQPRHLSTRVAARPRATIGHQPTFNDCCCSHPAVSTVAGNCASARLPVADHGPGLLK